MRGKRERRRRRTAVKERSWKSSITRALSTRYAWFPCVLSFAVFMHLAIKEEDILKRNYNVKTENQVDVSLLPKAMQVRNFGKVSFRQDRSPGIIC